MDRCDLQDEGYQMVYFGVVYVAVELSCVVWFGIEIITREHTRMAQRSGYHH